MRAFAILPLTILATACIPSIDQGGYAESDAPPRLETDNSALDVAPKSTWSSRQVSANAAQVDGRTYVVQSGDTLRGIGNRTGAGSEVIARANGLEPPYIIRPGQRLIIPAGRYHTVASGETGIAIARAYSVSWRDVVSANDLEEPYILRIGQKLKLPTGPKKDVASMTIEERAKAFSINIDDIVTGSQPALNEGGKAARAAAKRGNAPTRSAIAEPTGFNGKFRWPIAGSLLSRFGSKGGGRVNDGIDIRAPRGTPIKAAADGVVAYSGDEIDVFGGLILITHGSGYVTAYGHAETLSVVRGQSVKAGQLIGRAGQTGYVSQSQLHFEIRKNRKPVNPLLYLGKRS